MLLFEGNKARWIRFVLKYKNYSNKSAIFIGRGSRIANDTLIDIGSRFNGKITIKGKGKCVIGKYVAFGDNITLITSNHKTDEINLQYALAKKIGMNPKMSDKKDVIVGHNVWVGDGVIVIPGVHIGNGAIIGAGSVVTKDVPSFSIVAGSPAKFIRFRLSEERIKGVEDMKWWDWSIEKMRRDKHLL